MHIKLGLLLALGLSVLSQASAHAQVIGLNFEGPGPGIIGPTDTAGAIPQINWNNAAPSGGTLSSIFDSTGTTISGLSLTYTSAYNVGGTPSGASGYAELFAGGIESPYAAGPSGPAASNRITLDFSGITYASYDLYVYVANAPGYIYQNTSDATIGTNRQGFSALSQPDGTYTEGANYVKFSSLSGATQYLVASDETNSGGGGFNARVVGFQIVDTTVVPEPSSWALLAGGLATLLLLRFRPRHTL